MTGRLVLSAEGHWSHDGAAVTHEGIANYFTKHLVWAPEFTSFIVRVGARCVTVDVEDLPHVVVNMELRNKRVTLNTGAEESLDPARLSVSSAGIFYLELTSRDGSERARLRRAVAQQLWRCRVYSHPGLPDDGDDCPALR